jgi:hypothetical protein
MMTVHETERKNGSQSSNLYVINRFPKSEPPKKEQMNHPNKTINLSKTNQKINTRKEAAIEEKVNEDSRPFSKTTLDATFTSDRVPTTFVQLVKYFFNEAKTIEEFWRMTTIAANRHNREKQTDQVLSIAIQSFKQLISKIKSNTVVMNPIAYFFGIINKKFDWLYFEELGEMGNWDEDTGYLYDEGNLWFLEGNSNRFLTE